MDVKQGSIHRAELAESRVSSAFDLFCIQWLICKICEVSSMNFWRDALERWLWTDTSSIHTLEALLSFGVFFLATPPRSTHRLPLRGAAVAGEWARVVSDSLNGGNVAT